MKEKLRHLFFDLDHTLWDFETNSNATLSELFTEYRLEEHGLFDLDGFMMVYKEINHSLWDQYNRNQLGKEELRNRRFRDTFNRLGLEEAHHPFNFSDQYIHRCTLKPALFPGAHEVLTELRKRYSMSIITNGFPESQHRKMTASGLLPYFDHLIISEEVGFAKPHPGIFQAALDRSGTAIEEVIMIGDNLHADIEGAQKAGITAIWFNPDKNPGPEEPLLQIHDLNTLLELI